MADKKTQRRYYLHRKVKAFTRVHAKTRQVDIWPGYDQQITRKQNVYLEELKNIGYNLQFTIKTN